MSDDQVVVNLKSSGTGALIAGINGKTYTLLHGYQHWVAGGWFFLMVAGRVPLKADDLAKHWQVVKHGVVYVAFSQRPFSYHLLQPYEDADHPPEPPLGIEWPRLKRVDAFAFVGPTKEAVRQRVKLALEQFRPALIAQCAPDHPADRLLAVSDTVSGGPPALLYRV